MAKTFDPRQIHFVLNLLSSVSFGDNGFEPLGADTKWLLGALGELNEQSEKRRG